MENMHHKLSSNGLRGALAAHSETTNMSGGKKRRSHKNKTHKKSRKVSHKKRSRRSRRGGMTSKIGGSYAPLLKQAIVPFGLLSLLKNKQKKHHSKHHHKKTFRKSRKSKKR
jgi:hypothetical protein